MINLLERFIIPQLFCHYLVLRDQVLFSEK
jgi:hypothetical protein